MASFLSCAGSKTETASLQSGVAISTTTPSLKPAVARSVAFKHFAVGLCSHPAAAMQAATLRRSPLAAAAALRQLGQRAAGPTPAPAVPAAVSSLDLAVSPPSRARQIAAATRPAVACAATRDPAHPDLLAAQAKDAALLSGVAADLLRAGSANWQLEITSVLYGQRPIMRSTFDLDYMSSLALARGSAMAA